MVAGDAVATFNKRLRGRSDLSVALAPYPSTGIVDSVKAPEFGRICGEFWGHPDAEMFFAEWLALVETRLGDAGHRLLRQPAATTAGPFATRPEFASGRRDMAGGAVDAKTDHRHMNASFGHHVLDAYAREHLGLTPDTSFADAAE